MSVMIFPCATPFGVSKKLRVSENSSSDPMPCAPPPPMATAHAVFFDGASPPNALPIEAVNNACAAADASSDGADRQHHEKRFCGWQKDDPPFR